MPTRKSPRTLPTFVTLLLLATPALADPIGGVIQASDARHVTVNGRTYAIEADTELTDLGGGRVDVGELKPGTPCELDVDEAGHLMLLRAILVR